LRLQEFQDARKEMAKIAAKKNVPWRHNYGDADDNTLVFM
jgi:hypothetical protein